MDECSPPFSSPHDPAPVVFVNPAAGRGRAGRYLPLVRALLEQQGCPVQFVETKCRAELEDGVAQALAIGCRTLLAMGGDGTAQGLIQAAFGRDVHIGILPAGGGNDLAAALGFLGHPVSAAKQLLAAKPRRIDVARARTSDGNERIYVGGGGIGLDAEAAQFAANHYRRWPGRLRYIASALHALSKFMPMRVRAEFPGSDLPSMEAGLLIACVLNTPTYGAGLRFAPAARIDDGLLDATFIEHLRLPRLLALLPKLLTSGEIDTPGMKRMRCSKIRLTPERPCMFHGDGEVLGPAPVEIEVLARAVSILAPREE